MAKGITKDQIVAAALDVLDEQGIGGLTVRALAARLDVRAPALYWHMRDKQEMLDEMGTVVHRRVAQALSESSLGTGWRDGLSALAHALRSEYLLHRDGARTFSAARLTDAEVLRAQEPVLAQLTAAGFDIAGAADALDLVTAFVVGFVVEEQKHRQSAEAGEARLSLDGLGETAPLVKAAEEARDRGDKRFERQLRILLEGIAAGLDG
ncbi:TetR family transcriptional regulator [Actinoplanes sp. NBRC 14428]|uniref:TetR family transcriptional regulator n=1 Tax=Pseudosporangium ferrugineum TaxID=439699 RepID=A0A2T0SBI4_9ACTN|nr:TetR/AcrR family transcriptional regulator C-terminal domain-containing protein [Pseudosporangium ferrugineum]PRY30766.1 TetR family transcriptional regulator [Pseudosporangium ferrugineum]BCJ50320.1 TetR family transcriptional regulator [Actinoplanes sp. NBRC 14428]